MATLNWALSMKASRHQQVAASLHDQPCVESNELDLRKALAMSESERNAVVFRRYLTAVSGNDIDLDELDETLAEDVVHHDMPPGRPPGRAGMKAQQESFGSTWEDRNIAIEDVVAAGDKVAARLTLTARHSGEFAGIEPTGKQVRVDLMAVARIEGGRIAEWWEVADILGLFEQLGVSPLE